MDSEVAEHGVRFPAAQEFDGVGVHAGTEQSGGAAGAEAAGTEQSGVNAGLGPECASTCTEGCGDVAGTEVGPAAVKEVLVDRCCWGSTIVAKATGNTSQGADRAEVDVVDAALGDLFPADAVLLVSERQTGVFQVRRLHVIQRRVVGRVQAPMGCEREIFQAKWGRLAVFFAGEVLARPKQPEEGNKDEVDERGSCATNIYSTGGKGGGEALDDGDVDRVRAGSWGVF